MSSSLRLLILLACLGSLPALAAQSVEVSDTCPGPAAEAPSAATDTDSRSASQPVSESKAGAGGAASAADSAPRSRPRWQSFLPGMVR